MNEWPADKVQRMAVSALVPYARNSRTHSAAQVDQIAASIREWGWTTPVLVDEAGGIISGHGRVMAAQKLGIVDVPCMVATGSAAAMAAIARARAALAAALYSCAEPAAGISISATAAQRISRFMELPLNVKNCRQRLNRNSTNSVVLMQTATDLPLFSAVRHRIKRRPSPDAPAPARQAAPAPPPEAVPLPARPACHPSPSRLPPRRRFAAQMRAGRQGRFSLCCSR